MRPTVKKGLLSFAVVFGFLLCESASSGDETMNQSKLGKSALAYSELAGPSGYIHEEATQFVEFCVELDAQDDRLQHKDPSPWTANVDKSVWEIAFDTRDAIAEDYFTYKSFIAAGGNVDDKSLPPDHVAHWHKVFEDLETRARAKNESFQKAADIAANPNLNGFGPWQNAWILYRGIGPNNKGRYAIAIRGTVFSNSPSVIEDAAFQPVMAKGFLSPEVAFAKSENATLHSGFAHATYTLLFDLRYGVLPALMRERVPEKSILYIVGHSQGAAMVTLAHAFLFRAMQSAELGDKDPLHLKGARYRLKSYAIAQPKPGNYAFAADFASYTQSADNAIVINNDIDPVPKVPLTFEAVEDLATDFSSISTSGRIVRFVAGLGAGTRSLVSYLLEPWAISMARGYGYYYGYPDIEPRGSDVQSGSSWNFVPAGRVLLVYGRPGDKKDKGDDFYQHHSTTYRQLIGELKPGLSSRDAD